jgi:hypothetical protein
VKWTFLAELAEILNTAWPKPSGFPGGSSISEGLSKTMAAELYGYVVVSSELNAWLETVSLNALGNWQRQDWVSQTFASETDTVSTECAILFLNYLRYQLDFTWHQILAAGGETLAKAYERLTGKTTAWNDFSQLLLEHMPPSAYSPGHRGWAPATYNPFPLLPYTSRDGLAARGANLSQGKSFSTRPWLRSIGIVKIKPCFLAAEAKVYSYMRLKWNETITVTLNLYGFAFPYVLAWSLKDPTTRADVTVAHSDPPRYDYVLDPPLDYKGPQTLVVDAGVEDLHTPGTFAYSKQSVEIEGADPNPASRYDFFTQQRSYSFSNNGNPSYAGDFHLEFSADVCEWLVPNQVTRISGIISCNTIVLVMGGDYTSDHETCVGAVWKAVKNYVRVAPITVGPPPPDPPPGWREALHWMAQMRAELAVHARADPNGARRAADLLGQYFGVEPQGFLGELP